MKWLKASLKLVGLVTMYDGDEMSLSLMPSEIDLDELVFVVTLEREEFAVNKSLMPS